MVLTGLYLVKRGKNRVRKEPVRINKNIIILAEYKLWYLYDILRPLKLSIHWRTVNRFLSIVSFSLAWEKTESSDRIDEKYVILAIYLQIRGGGGVFGQCEVEKRFLHHNIRTILDNKFCMLTRCILRPPP